MGVLIILLFSIIILVNLILNIKTLSHIVSYCFETGDLSEYWSLFYRGCIHARALYSSVISLTLGVIVFVCIAPFVLISGFATRKEIAEKINEGLHFPYHDLDFRDKIFSFTNIQELGIEKFRAEAKGNIQIDCVMIMIEIAAKCEAAGIKIEQNILQHYDLENKKKVTIPMVIDVGEKVFPVYFIYDDFHKAAYHKINPILKANHFENAIYFSVINMERDTLTLLQSSIA